MVKSDAEPAQALVARAPDALVLSPGPGRAGGCRRTSPRPPRVPSRGGRRCSGCASATRPWASSRAARVERATPVHGKASLVRHDGRGNPRRRAEPLRGRPLPLPGGGSARASPSELELTAWSDDDLVMATQHRYLAAVRRAVPPRVDPDAGRPDDRPQLPVLRGVGGDPAPCIRRPEPLGSGPESALFFGAYAPNLGLSSPPGIFTNPSGISSAALTAGISENGLGCRPALIRPGTWVAGSIRATAPARRRARRPRGRSVRPDQDPDRDRRRDHYDREQHDPGSAGSPPVSSEGLDPVAIDLASSCAGSVWPRRAARSRARYRRPPSGRDGGHVRRVPGLRRESVPGQEVVVPPPGPTSQGSAPGPPRRSSLPPPPCRRRHPDRRTDCPAFPAPGGGPPLQADQQADVPLPDT